MPTPNPLESQRIEHSSIQGGKIQQGQAKNLTQIQADNLTKVYISLFDVRRLTETEELWLSKAERLLSGIVLPDVTQRLKYGLYQDTSISLDLEEQPRQVGIPAPTRLVQVDGKLPEELDIKTKILEVFGREDIKGKLLILGTPGSGKTTILLTLARELVEKALSNLGSSIPVIFELSAWKEGYQDIESFLVEQLKEIGVKPKVSKRWIEKELLVPLLDGLDELGLKQQRKCVQQLNNFARHYPYLVVCCRSEEYKSGNIRLSNLRTAIYLQALTATQIQRYLQQVGQKSLWEAIKLQREIQPMLRSNEKVELGILQIPLLLRIAAEIYEGKLFESKLDLFEAYISKQLDTDTREWERKQYKNKKWTYRSLKNELEPQKTKFYLSQLAEKMIENHQVEFLIEKLQPSWLGNKSHKLMYRLLASSGETLIYSAFMFMGGLPVIIIVNFALCNMLLANIFFASNYEQIHPVEFIRLSKSNSYQKDRYWHGRYLGYILVTPLVMIILMTKLEWSKAFVLSWLVGMNVGKLIGLIFERATELKNCDYPNQGVINSMKNMFLITITFYLPFVALLNGSVASELIPTDYNVWLIAFSISSVLGFAVCGVACVQHYALRFVLDRNANVAPLDYSRFLNNCSERRLLQAVGGRYRFLHRELLEHFAHK